MGGAINQPGAKGEKQSTQDLDAITWLLFLSDGQNDLLTIAERSEISFDRVIDAANILLHAGLLEPVAA
jgi:aminopeptidase-like protein